MPETTETLCEKPREDGRQTSQLRPVELLCGYTRYAPGSVLVSFGHTKVLVTASIEERVPRHILQQSKEDPAAENKGWLTAEYSMLPSATHTRNGRDRVKVPGRTTEIQRLIGRCLRASIDLNHLGNRTITIDADVLQADGGTRVAAITGGYVALVDALSHLKTQGLLETLPIVSPIAAVSVGIVNGVPLLDLDYAEDSSAEVDANVVMNANGELIEFQASSEQKPFTPEAMQQLLALAQQGIYKLLDLQQTVLANRP